MNRSLKTILKTASIVAVLVLLFFISQRRTVTVDSGSRQIMGTLARVVAVAKSEKQAQAAISKAFDCMELIQKLMSDRDPNSQLSNVNQQAFRRPVKVDDSLFKVLSASLEYSRLSEGAFDITIGPVVQLWRIEQKTGTPPAPEALSQARALVGWENLVLDPAEKSVRFAKEGMKLDLGAIAKGYAVDKAVDELRQSGMLGGMVDIGGNIRCFGKSAGKTKHWQIGLQDPRGDDIVLILILDDMAVATSGDYRRFAVVDGKSFSHIINPATAQSAQTLSSVTVIAPSAMRADALSTAVTVLEEQKGLALIESLQDTQSILIKNGEMIKSKNADHFLLKSHNNK